MAIAIKNLDAALGAEIADIDLSKPLPRGDVDAIEAAWRERLVVVFHGQSLSDPQLVAFSRNFGELDPPGPNPYGESFNKEHPELNVISNVVEDGKPYFANMFAAYESLPADLKKAIEGKFAVHDASRNSAGILHMIKRGSVACAHSASSNASLLVTLRPST